MQAVMTNNMVAHVWVTVECPKAKILEKALESIGEIWDPSDTFERGETFTIKITPRG